MDPAFADGMRCAVIACLLCLIVSNACADLRIEEHAGGTRMRSEGRVSLVDLVAQIVASEVSGRRPSFILPAEGRVSSPFGGRRDPLGGGAGFHEGIDIAHAPGAWVRAAAGGRVAAAGAMGGCGIAAVIEHAGGISTRYCHLRWLAVRRGEHVITGQRIGSMGATGRATGPHLHFELRDHGIPVDPAERLYY
jgi:murein DD-endopeptidase MepM/ murein hydrolase activator NlpD